MLQEAFEQPGRPQHDADEHRSGRENYQRVRHDRRRFAGPTLRHVRRSLGIGAARRWLAAQFAAAAQGTRLKTFEDRFTAEPGRRIPAAAELINVGVVLPGTDPARAKQGVRFIEHYRSYVINYTLGEDMVRRYIEKRGGTADQPEKRWREFEQLLSSPRLPTGLQ